MKTCSTSGNCSKFLVCIITSLLFLFSGGCIPVADRKVAPLDTLPLTFSIEGEQPAQTNWWLDFRDQELNRLIQIAFEDNFTVQIARKRIEELQASARLAGASLLPSAEGKLSGTSTRDYSARTSGNNFLLDFAASYELDLWGRLSSQKDAALLDVQASKEDYHTAVITIAAEIAQTWYELAENQMQLDLLDQQIEVNSKILELISTQFRAGKVGVADILQQQQLLERNTEDQSSLRSEISQLQHKIAVLLGNPPNSLITEQAGKLPDLPPLPKSGIPLGLLTTRPDIISSFAKLKASDYRVAAAVADRFPRLSISGSFNTASERAQDLFNDWFSTLGANLLGPLIDGGKRKAEVDRRKALAAQNFLQYGETIIQAIKEVEDALVKETAQQRILQSRQNQFKLAAQALQHIGNRYRQGVDDYQRVLTSLLSHQNLQRSILNSKQTLINNRIALYRATSGRLHLSEVSLSKGRDPLPRQ